MYSSIDNFEIYTNLIDKIYLKSGNLDKDLLCEAQKNDNANKYEVELKTVFGNWIKFEHHDEKIGLNELKRKCCLNQGIFDPNVAIISQKGKEISNASTLFQTKKSNQQRANNETNSISDDLVVSFREKNLNSNKEV